MKHAIFIGRPFVAGNMPLAQRCFGEVAQALAERHGGAPLILGCTEIPLLITQLI